uniref:Astacin domain-containing protein n=1 Tax=Heterorhabditis bacteriophora TaxID=37862 RepID=A0A1I7WQ65_HETBA
MAFPSAARATQPTMIARDSNYQDTMGSSIVSFNDVSMMNEHYKCKSRCPVSSSARCLNGGFPHPRSCSRCICPSGYGGNLCNKRPPGCGSTANATSVFQQLKSTVAKPRDSEEDFTACHYWIQIEKKLQIALELIYIEYFSYMIE